MTEGNAVRSAGFKHKIARRFVARRFALARLIDIIFINRLDVCKNILLKELVN